MKSLLIGSIKYSPNELKLRKLKRRRGATKGRCVMGKGRKERGKRAREEKFKGQLALGVSRTKLKAGLELFGENEADEIIASAGEPGDDYAALLQATQANIGVLFAALTAHGLQRNERTLDLAGKTTTMALQLVHFAFAAGVRMGQSERD